MRVAKRWGVLALVALMGCGGVAVEELEGLDETALASQEETLGAEEVASLRARHERGELEWVRATEGPSVESGRAVAHDRQGNAYVVMAFLDSIDLGETSFTSERGTVLVKYSRQGRLVWARLFEGFFPVESLAVDERGNILLAMRLFDSYDLGDATLPPGVSVVKLDKKGRFVWSRSVAVLEGGIAHLGEVAVDRWGNVLLAGALLGTADFGEGPVSSGEDRAAFLVKYDDCGRFEWLYLRDVESWGDGIALDDRGNAFLIGSTTRPEIGQRSRTAFLLKLSRRGEPRWTGHVPLGGFTDVAIGDNRVLVSGIFRGSFPFAGETISSEEVPGVFDADGFVLAWSLKGEEHWGRNFGETVDVLATDERGNVFAAGIYAPGEDLGTGPLPGDTSGPAADLYWNFYVMKLEADDGDQRWVRHFVSAGAAPFDIAATKHGESTVVGAFLAPVDLGTGLLTPARSEAFVLRLGK